MHRSAAATSYAGAFPPHLGRRQQQHHQQPPHVVLYVVRHGESTGNREGVLQGQMDYPLTEIGRAQAVETGRRLRAEAEEALADGAADTSSSGGSNSRGSEQTSGPPPPIAFFHRIFSSDLSRARETAELIVQELLDREHGGDGGGEQAAAAPEGVIGFDLDLREILGGVREGRPLGTSAKAAARQAAREQGVPLEAFVAPPYETAKDLRRRARRFVETVLTEVHASLFGAEDTDPSQEQRPHRRGGSGSGSRRGLTSALMLASPFRNSKTPPPREGDVGGEEERRPPPPPLPVRILIVSHGGLLLQMFQKVFNLHAVTRVLNASLTVVEARLPTSHPATHPHHASTSTTTTTNNDNRRRLALIFASPASSRTQPRPQGESNEGEEGAAAAPLAAATAFRPVRINDVAHLEALKIVTTKSTAL